MSTHEFPRPLTAREADTLNFMLSPDDPRLNAFRDQAKRVAVVDRWECCATIDLMVESEGVNPAKGHDVVISDTRTPNHGDAETFFELILFERGGLLHTLELVHYGRTPPKEFPPASEFEPPTVA